MTSRRTPLRTLACLLGTLAAAALSACPETQTGHAPTSCSKAYDKCELPNGVLGVCDVVECTEAATPPCLTCRSQH